MIQHQWIMFEDRDIQLCEALFLLRASRSSIVSRLHHAALFSAHCAQILESTNSLISLLAEASDSLFFLGVLRDALAGYLEAVPTSTKEDLPTSCSTTNGNTASEVVTGERARASGYLFGLNAMGICMLKLPKEVVEVEGRRLAPVISEVSISSTLELLC